MNTPPEEYGFANRAQDLMVNHPWMDHPTVVALAQQNTDPQQTNANGQTVAQAVAQTWDGYEQTWSDPVLQTQPTLTTGIGQYIKDTIGAPPIDAGTITQLQTALQKDGLGTNLASDGAWTADWQQQYNQALQTLRTNQLAGEKPGSVKTSSALHGFLGHLTVTGALDAIGGYVKSLPNDARIALGEVAGAGAGIGHVVSHPSEILGNSKAEQETIASANSATQNFLGGHTSKTQQVQAESVGGQLSALNAALSVALVTGIGKKAAVDIGENIARGTLEKGSAEAVRRPGVIAKTLFNAKGNGRLLGSRWAGNLPGLARVTPMVGKAAGSDGWYYGARTFIAQPYRYAAVRAAGQAFSRTQLAGLGLYGDALATSKLPGNTEAQDVLNGHVFSAIDHNITQYGPKMFGYSPLDVNNLALFLHGPIGLGTKGSASTSTGEAVQSFLDGFTNTLGVKGLPAAFQQATGMGRQDWLQAAGGDSHFLAAFMTSKALGYVRDWWADKQLGEQLNGSNLSQRDRLTALRKQFNGLPVEEKAKAAQDLFASDPSMTYLTRRIQGDIARSSANPKAAAANALAEFKTQTEAMQKIQRAGGLQYLMTPEGQAILGDLVAEHNAANLPDDFGSAAHMATLMPNVQQDLGLMRVENLTRQDVLDPGGLRDQFQAALDAAGDDPLAQEQVAKAISDHLFENHNLDDRALGVFGAAGDPKKLLSVVEREAQTLAADVTPTYDMPEHIQAMIDDLRSNGYKIVVGDHLGDFYSGNLPDIGANNGWLTALRKWAGKTGIDPTRVPDQEVGAATRQGIVSSVQPVMNDLRDQGKLADSHQTGSTLLAMLAEDGGVDKTLPWYARAIFHGTSKIGLNKTEIEFMHQNGLSDSEAAARAELEQRMASGLGPRDTSRKAIVAAIMQTHLVRTKDGQEWTWNGLPGGDITDEEAAASPAAKAARRDAEKTANLIYRAMLQGYRQPGYIMGWQAIENFARAGHGFPMIGKVIQRFPGSSLAQNVANWPNRVAQVRNRLRFTASFAFDMRRWTKQSVKMAAEGVEPVANPLQSLLDEKSAISAQRMFQKLAGRQDVQDQMDADRMLAGRSIYGIYNPAWHGAYFINEVRKKLEAQTPEVVARVNPNRLKPGEVSVFRHHLPEENLDDASSRPAGVYYQLHGPAEVPGAYRYKGRVTTDRAGSSNVPTLTVDTNRYDSNAGYEAIVKLGGRDLARRIQAGAESDPHIVADEIRTKFGVTVSPDDGDGMYLADVYGAALARKAGYKAIVFHAPDGTGEFVDLGDATRSVAAPTAAENKAARSAMIEKEIKDAYNRVFKYGKGGGTSPLERTINTVFFPFSFEKTLLRNLGGYLLDRPAQALALDLAVDEWRKADKNATIGKWVDDHFPILWEMNQLNNAFTHGISPGELGGINAPLIGGAATLAGNTVGAAATPGGLSKKSAALLNLFIPQDWGGNLNQKTLARYLPVWNQFAQVWHSVYEQTYVGVNGLYDLAQEAAHTSDRRPLLTQDAQREYGIRAKVKMADKLQPVLEYNAKQGDDASKILWPAGTPGNLAGQPVNKTTIGEFVQTQYPAYDPLSGTAYAEKQQRAEANFISQVSAQDPTKGQQMASFAKLANTVIGRINRDQYDPADLAKVQGAFQTLARTTSRTDPEWLHLWESFFAYALGPVRSPNGKVAA